MLASSVLNTPTIVFHLANLVVGLVAVVSGVMTAIVSYFWLHADLDMSRRQMWEHIWGLLAFFILGNLLGGMLAFCAMKWIGAL